MCKRLEDKAIIVVGAGTSGEGTGNGRAAAILYAREGASVLCVDRDEEAVGLTVEAIRDEGGSAEHWVADVTSEKDCERVVTTCREKLGKLDVLHNNVGISAGGELASTAEGDWSRVFDANVKGMFLMCKHAIPRMIEGGGGSIINISSIRAIRPSGRSVSYASSKGAVNTLTRYIAYHYGKHNIRANALILGAMDTPMVRPALQRESDHAAALERIPLRRMASPFEGANAAVFLASDDSSYVTGALLPVDGGLSAAI
jgi:NAD(P)-dependent dehydrogenase (short-subunit alcohol dehydrogenase family)